MSSFLGRQFYRFTLYSPMDSLHMDTSVLDDQQKIYIHQLWTDTWCRLEDLQSLMAKLDRLQEKVKWILAVSYAMMMTVRDGENIKIFFNIHNKNISCLSLNSTAFKLGTFVCLFGFYRISTFVGYLMPNPFLYK